MAGSGRARTLTWRSAALPHQRVVFWEKGRDVARVIGSTSASRGSLRFTVAGADSRRRSIEAQVFSFGRPRADITIAHYAAPPPSLPGRPGRVRVTAAGTGGIRVSWSAASGAEQYRVAVDTGGARLIQFAGAKARSIVVHNVVPITSATVTVTAARLDGVTGPPARVKFPAGRGRHKRNH